MNIKNTCALVSAALSVLLLSASCSSEFMPEDDAVNAENKLCFAVGGVQTRLVYDYEQTDFADGEAIGCVIAEKNSDETYTFRCNTKWTYRASDGMLILDYNSDSNVGTYITDDTEKDDEAYLTVTPGNKLQFFFYYPYVNNQLLEDDFTDKTDYKSLTYPNCATSNNDIQNNKYSIALTGEVAASYSAATADAFAKYSWTEYPCFVNHTQGAVTGTTYDDKRLHNSDFLWAAASPEISSTTNHTVNLTFQKKTATILVYSEVKLNDIYFVPNGAQTLIRGKKIDLSTGKLTDYDNTAGNTQEKNMYFNAGEHIVPCYRGTDTEEGSTDELHFYRLVLPAQTKQTGCSFTMHVEATDFNKDINLSANDNLTELKEGCMYAIRISKSGKTTIRINDWKVNNDNSGGTLEENK